MMNNRAHNFKDLTGKKFHLLSVLKFAKTKNGRSYWLCKCECGTVKEVEAYMLAHRQKSCGCLKKEQTKIRNSKLYTTHGKSNSRLYRIWLGMKTRCFNKNSQAFERYGKRGITVCHRWLKFENFYDDMHKSYYKHCSTYTPKQTTLDRINNNGNYEPKNCRWTTYSEQANNRPYSHKKLSKAGKLGAMARWHK